MEQKPKVQAIYKAVLELLDEGLDIAGMRVSQVAARAGIGKGTVYDYFSSKEEMVVDAILYEIRKMTEEISGVVKAETGFKGKMYGVFRYMEQSMEENHGLARMFRLMDHTRGMSPSMQELLEKRKDEACGIRKALTGLSQEAQKEGLAGELPDSVVTLTISAKLLMFLMYLERKADIGNMDREKWKSYLYQGILADFSVRI